MELLPRSALLTVWQVSAMNDLKIRQIFEHSYGAYSAQKHHPSDIQQKAAHAILDCKSGKLGYNISQCSDCGHMQIHNNSCRNRSCPNCQAVLKEVWVDKRRAEVIDSPYFMWYLPFHMSSTLLFTVTRSCYTASCTDAVPKRSWNCQQAKSISGHSPGSSRFSIPGIRNWITMFTCIMTSGIL